MLQVDLLTSVEQPEVERDQIKTDLDEIGSELEHKDEELAQYKTLMDESQKQLKELQK